MWRFWNKILIACFSIAATAVLVGIDIGFERVVPDRSGLTGTGAAASLAFAIFAVLAVYAWACDRCDDYLSGLHDCLFEQRTKRLRAQALTQKSSAGNLPGAPVVSSNQLSA